MKTILIVEDEPWVVEVVKTFLKDQDYYIIVADTLSGASKMIEFIETHVVLCDIHMKGEDGNGEMFASWIRTHTKLVPRIIASTGGNVNDPSLFDAIIKKPYTRQDLITSIEGKEPEKPWE